MESRPNRSTTPTRVAKFFLWSAGADPGILARVPRSESVRQIGFGTLVLVPAVLAFFAMSYALSTLTERPWIFFGGGAVWAIIVFCFDRFIVSTFRKSRQVLDDVMSLVFVTRVVFAIFVGIIVAHPLVLLYFDDSLEDRLLRDQRIERSKIAATRAGEAQQLEVRIGAMKAEIRTREEERNGRQDSLTAEIDGIVTGRTTGIPGRGDSAREKERQLRLAEEELVAARDRNLAEIAALQERIIGIAVEDRRAAEGFTQSLDYLARATALGALSAESEHVRLVKWFLILFFVFVDTLPIVFKGFTPRGPYDDALELEELESERATSARRESLEGVAYPYMVLDSESRYVADRGYRGAADYARRYRDFLDELSRHQATFLSEWQHQQDVLSRLEDETLRESHLEYMHRLRETSVEVVHRAVERFNDSLAWESRQRPGGAEAG